MTTPGSNLLNQALTVIARQQVVYYKMTGRTLNDVGQDVTSYALGTTLRGSFQPVPRNLYPIYGLDLQKTYYTFYVPSNVLDIGRDVSGDQIAFNDDRFQCESNNDWFSIDGWKGILCVRIGIDGGDLRLFGFNTLPSSNSYKNFERGNFLVDGA